MVAFVKGARIFGNRGWGEYSRGLVFETSREDMETATDMILPLVRRGSLESTSII
jgi:hypothetical protein